MTQKRIQLHRTKGYRKPAGAVNVARPGRWGNRFRIGDPDVPDAATAVRLFRQWAGQSFRYSALAVRELRGKDLACWCPLGSPCHADVLLEIANKPIRAIGEAMPLPEPPESEET